MEQLMPFLQELAASLGTTADQLWDVLLKQVSVEITLCQLWMSIFFWAGIVIAVLSAIFFFFSIKGDEEDMAFFSGGVFILNLVVAITGYYINYSKLLTLRNNPEYWALKEILNAIN